MKIKNLSLFLIINNFLIANSFHYYSFKVNYEKEKELNGKKCYLCPKEIRKSQKNKIVIINGRKYTENQEGFSSIKRKSYAELKYGQKIKYKNYKSILKENRAKNSLIMISANYSPYTTTVNNDKFDAVNGKKVYNPPSIFKHNEISYSLDLFTLFPTHYFGFRENTPSYYVETKLSSVLDMFLYKELLNGRVGKFYAFVGGGLRVNFQESSSTDFLKPLLGAKIGFMFTDSMGLFFGTLVRDKIIKDSRTEDKINDNIYELNLSLGWRF